jgi:hypothetical protein
MTRPSVIGCLLSLCIAGSGVAQPEDFINLGRRVVQETIVVPIHLDFAEDVQWVRIELPAVTAGAGFVDVWTRVEVWTETDLLWPTAIVYDNTGQRHRFFERGSFNQVYGSLGQRNPHRPPNVLENDTVECHWPFEGQHGPIADGVYWIPVSNYIAGYYDGWDVRVFVHPTLQAQRNTTLYIRVHPPEVPYCDPDLNWDGNADMDDVAFLIDLIARGEWEPCIADADYNRDGNRDFDDVRALIDVIAGGGCP